MRHDGFRDRRDGEVGQQAFEVIREAIKEEGMVALGKVVFPSREHIIALEPRGKGLLGMTLRYPYEVRDEKNYFDDIPSEKVPKDMLAGEGGRGPAVHGGADHRSADRSGGAGALSGFLQDDIGASLQRVYIVDG
jgi:hypothetical protein